MKERRRPRRALPALVAMAGIALLFHASSRRAPLAQPAADDGPAPAAPAGDSGGDGVPGGAAEGTIAPAKFDHASHQNHEYPNSQKKAVTDENCSSCHGSDARGTLATPAKSGHQPCLSAGCHAKWFVSAGPNTHKRDPVLYRKAVSFCLGCHASESGEPPRRHTQARAEAVYRDNQKPNYHVDFNHFEHTAKTPCRSCHIVNRSTFELELDTPGHAQCAACHGVEDDAEPMGQCAECHKQPGPAEYFGDEWKGSETRSCGSPSHLELAAKSNEDPAQVPCFKHEREGHRFRDRGREALECGQCHFMIGNQRLWNQFRYESVREIRSSPIIHNERDRAHESCGDSRACHRRDVDDGRGSANCRLCHSQKTINDGLFSE